MINMDIYEEPNRHFVVEKCSKCPYNYKGYFTARRKYCNHPKARMKQIELRGKKFPKWCPLDVYITERCDNIQLKRKKMLDNIKRKKRCKK